MLAEYGAPASGVYSSEVATPPLSVFVPALVPPVRHGVALAVGPQTKNATEPVGAGCPFGPVSVAVSVMEVRPTVAAVELTWVTMVGSGNTPEALRALSCAPQLKLQESSAMWYGEPLIAEAEWPAPQSIDDPMWPPHASTGFGTLEVKLIVIVLFVFALVGAQPASP